MATRLRNFDPPNAFVNPDGTLTERAQWYLRELFRYIGADQGQIPIDSIGGDGSSTDRFLREDGEFAIPNSPANPTATVGETAVNGSANTFMRSDAAPAIDLSMTPTWLGAHNFGAGLTGSSCALTNGFGCNGASAQASKSVNAAIAGSAGGAYTGTEQALINSLIALVNQLRLTLIENGIAV